MQFFSWKKHNSVALNHDNNDWTSYWTAEETTAINSIAICTFTEKTNIFIFQIHCTALGKIKIKERIGTNSVH